MAGGLFGRVEGEQFGRKGLAAALARDVFAGDGGGQPGGRRVALGCIDFHCYFFLFVLFSYYKDIIIIIIIVFCCSSR